MSIPVSPGTSSSSLSSSSPHASQGHDAPFEFSSSRDDAIQATLAHLRHERARVEMQESWAKMFEEHIRPQVERTLEAEVAEFDAREQSVLKSTQVWAEYEHAVQAQLMRLQQLLGMPCKVARALPKHES